MGQLSFYTDPTGKMSETQVNAENIQQVIAEFNRSQDLLDSLNTTPKIIARGSVQLAWDGTLHGGGSYLNSVTVNIGAATNFNFLTYVTLASQPSNLYFVPYFNIDSSKNMIYELYAFSESATLFFTLDAFQASSAETFTFSYFVIQQPSNVSTS